MMIIISDALRFTNNNKQAFLLCQATQKYSTETRFDVVPVESLSKRERSANRCASLPRRMLSTIPLARERELLASSTPIIESDLP